MKRTTHVPFSGLERHPERRRPLGRDRDARHGLTAHARGHARELSREERRVGMEADEQPSAHAAQPLPPHARTRPGVVRVEAAHARQRRERPAETPERRPQVVAGDHASVGGDGAVEQRVRRVHGPARRRAHDAVGVDPNGRLADPPRRRLRRVVDPADAPVEELVLVHREPIGASRPQDRHLVARSARARRSSHAGRLGSPGTARPRRSGARRGGPTRPAARARRRGRAGRSARRSPVAPARTRAAPRGRARPRAPSPGTTRRAGARSPSRAEAGRTCPTSRARR